jgi:hypothetical protein
MRNAVIAIAVALAAGVVASPTGVVFERATQANSTVQTTRNDVLNAQGGQGCKGMTVIFARGTTEPGNVGQIAGPPFFDALNTAMGAGNVAVQGVDYPADIPGFLEGGDKNGSVTMAQLVQQVATSCPQTKIVMGGYRLVEKGPCQIP